jgi:hypothetical protein
MPNEFWDTTPNHTNLVETAHAATNRMTDINLRPLEAIQQYVLLWIQGNFTEPASPSIIRARVLDARMAASIMTAGDACILSNPNNSEVTQLTRLVSRRRHSARRRAVHNTIDDNIEEVQEDFAMTSQAQKELKAKLKDLTEMKKEAGRTPKHNRAATRKFDGIDTPQIRGLKVSQLGTNNHIQLHISD